MTVLIVDDNQTVRRVIRDYLPASCVEVFECGDGQEALLLYEKHQPDWVLMDWQMPEMDGASAIRKIISRYPHARICMVTSFDDEAIRRDAIDAGALGFLLKDDLFDLERIMTGENPKVVPNSLNDH